MRGRSIPLSLHRRWVVDNLHFSKLVPTVPVQKRIQIADVIAARKACRNRPRWTAIFAKAYALMARDFPELRRTYIALPWPHLYEYSESKVAIAIERDYQGEAAVLPFMIRDPAVFPLRELSENITKAEDAPAEQLTEFKRLIIVTQLPRPLRRTLWRLLLNVGRWRGRFFGTFSLSVYSALRAESLHPLSVNTTLNYGVFNPDGSVDVRIIYDHRVTDGATIARALVQLEKVLNQEILQELHRCAAE